MSYLFYLDKMLLPVAPSKLQLKVNNQNKTMTLINEGEVNVLKRAGLTTIEFEALLPNVKYPFSVYKSEFQRASAYLDKLESLKQSNSPFQFIVTRAFPTGKQLFDTNIKVSLEEYTVIEDTKHGFDITVSIKLKQYNEFSTKVYKISTDNKNTISTLSLNRNTKNSPAPKEATTYKIKSGDTLWAIAKKYYGDGSKYTVIYSANKGIIEKPNLIYPGQVITIPKEA